MKKRFLIPAVAIGGFAGLCVLGLGITQNKINACNAGDETVCKELAKKHWDNSLVRSEIRAGGAVFFAEAAKYEKQAKQADTFQVNRTNVAMLALSCEQKQIRPFLKDPNSFRKLGHTYKETVDQIYVQVNYTATNGFGGRVQGNKVCTYTL
jgi:hypothetical protein